MNMANLMAPCRVLAAIVYVILKSLKCNHWPARSLCNMCTSPEVLRQWTCGLNMQQTFITSHFIMRADLGFDVLARRV